MANLLIVDDDVDVAELLAELLTMKGHICRLAHNGHEGLLLVKEQKPDLLLLDVELPQLSGPGVAHTLLLRNCGDEKIPILLLSGVVDLPCVARRVGTPYYLGKPYTFESLLQVITRALVERIPPSPNRVELER